MLDQPIRHLAGYQCGQFLPGLAIPRSSRRDRALLDSLAAAQQAVHLTPQQPLYGCCKRPVAAQSLRDHQPDHHREAVDTLPDAITLLLANLFEEPGRYGLLLKVQNLGSIGGGHDYNINYLFCFIYGPVPENLTALGSQPAGSRLFSTNAPKRVSALPTECRRHAGHPTFSRM